MRMCKSTVEGYARRGLLLRSSFAATGALSGRTFIDAIDKLSHGG